jgi:hypothetical protein
MLRVTVNIVTTELLSDRNCWLPSSYEVIGLQTNAVNTVLARIQKYFHKFLLNNARKKCLCRSRCCK